MEDIRELVSEIIDKVERLEGAIGNLISVLEESGKEVDDSVFDMINDIRDGYDDVDEIVNALTSED